MLSKTAFNRMKKAELVEHCLAAQQKMCRDALFASEEDEVDAQAVQSITLSTVMTQRDELRAVNKKLVKDIKELSEAKDKLNSAWAKKRDEIYSDHRKQIKEIKKEKMSCEFKKLKATIEELKDKIKDLKDENTEYRMTCPKLRCDIHSLKDSWKFSREENEKLKEEIKELKELTDGIMEESNTQHILGCNAYEKFIQAMTELNYDEKWIKELKDENEELKAAMDTT
tara:strand:+ start:519 stop:1199 length:681 start_codon:yes stop_codon:yes gene_type:complete